MVAKSTCTYVVDVVQKTMWSLSLLFFFFSSRRRHTRLVSDWSSDVCSSDLYGNLAGVYESQGKLSDAEPLRQRALEIHEEHLGATHPYTAIGLNNLASLLEKLEKYGEAEPMYCRCVEIAQNVLGEEHPYTKKFTSNLQRLIKTVIEKNQTAQLSDHPLTQAILQQLQNQNPDPDRKSTRLNSSH